MGKAVRYFDQSNEKEETTEKSTIKKQKKSKILTFNIEPKLKPWGRRREDNRILQKRKFKNKQSNKTNNPKVKGKYRVPKEVLKKYKKGPGISKTGIKTNLHRKKIEKKEAKIKFSIEQTAKTETLLIEDTGFLEASAGETTTQFRQNEIVNNVDITAATKHFDLKLNDFGPYRMRYTRNGRHLLLGGKSGHVAAIDWITKKMHCELNVMETVHDICWLHQETMFAVAQKQWVYIYDDKGIELHCIKRMNKVTRMEFLPYHFLLASCSDEGYLAWLDVSIGEIISLYGTYMGRLTMMAQNPWNAVLCLGHSKGVVSMWSPNSKKPLAKMLCHKAPLTALHIDPKGQFMATAATNRELKIWDIRKLDGPLQQYKLASAAQNLAFSQKSMLAVGMGNLVEVYRDCCLTTAKRPYLRERFVTPIGNMNFSPYEDVLGVATGRGFTSLLVPGSGEPNFDAFEANPFQTKSQRRETEVKSLLEKIQPELITLDPTQIAEVDIPTLKDKIEAREKLLHVKPPKINYTPRNKAKGKGGSAKIAKNRKIVQEQAKKEFIKNVKDLQPKFGTNKINNEPPSVLDRFRTKR